MLKFKCKLNLDYCLHNRFYCCNYKHRNVADAIPTYLAIYITNITFAPFDTVATSTSVVTIFAGAVARLNQVTYTWCIWVSHEFITCIFTGWIFNTFFCFIITDLWKRAIVCKITATSLDRVLID